MLGSNCHRFSIKKIKKFNSKAILRCRICHLPNYFDGVRNIKNGICNLCQNYVPRKLHGLQALKNTITSNPKRKYDCIVPVSGGKDSTYVLYVAKEVLKLKVLAINFGNPFSNPIAIKNVEKACESLDVELRIISSKYNCEVKYVRHFLKAFRKLGYFFGICNFCHAGIKLAVYKEALKENIPFVLWGNTFHEDVHVGEKTKIKLLMNAIKKLSAKELLGFIYHLLLSYIYLTLQKIEFYFPPMRNLLPWVIPHPQKNLVKDIYVYSYIDWDANYIIKVLKENLDWNKPIEKHDAMRFDCKLEAIGEYTWMKAFGISTSGVICSNLIRAGKLKKEKAALEIIENNNYKSNEIKNHIKEIIKISGLKIDEFNELFN